MAQDEDALTACVTASEEQLMAKMAKLHKVYSLLISSLELSDTKVYEPYIRALLSTRFVRSAFSLTIVALKFWVSGANVPALELERTRTHRMDEPEWTEADLGRCAAQFVCRTFNTAGFKGISRIILGRVIHKTLW